MPKVNNGRDRVMLHDEQQALATELKSCKNPAVVPMLTLLLQTAMHTGEPLGCGCWSHVDWDAGVLRLGDSKSGKCDAPLSAAAIGALKQLAALHPRAPHERIVRIGYNALAALDTPNSTHSGHCLWAL